jgi:hypothetical protein
MWKFSRWGKPEGPPHQIGGHFPLFSIGKRRGPVLIPVVLLLVGLRTMGPALFQTSAKAILSAITWHGVSQIRGGWEGAHGVGRHLSYPCGVYVPGYNAIGGAWWVLR